MSRARRIYQPRQARVKMGKDGAPRTLGGIAVETIREEWVIEDRWWSVDPLHRHYYELVLADGRSVVVFREVQSGRWRHQVA